MTPLEVEIKKNEYIIELLFHNYDKITSKDNTLLVFLLFYSLDKQ